MNLFYRKWVLRGANVPQAIISDRGAVFTSKFWSSLCYFLRIKQKLSMVFHPQTDGQTECQNQTLEQYLRAYVAYQQDDWGTWLPIVTTKGKRLGIYTHSVSQRRDKTARSG